MKRAITLQPQKPISKSKLDIDSPPWSEGMLGPPVYKRGNSRKASTKVITTVKLDADVIAFFKALGRGYQTRINSELRKVVQKELADDSKQKLRRVA